MRKLGLLLTSMLVLTGFMALSATSASAVVDPECGSAGAPHSVLYLSIQTKNPYGSWTEFDEAAGTPDTWGPDRLGTTGGGCTQGNEIENAPITATPAQLLSTYGGNSLNKIAKIMLPLGARVKDTVSDPRPPNGSLGGRSTQRVMTWIPTVIPPGKAARVVEVPNVPLRVDNGPQPSPRGEVGCPNQPGDLPDGITLVACYNAATILGGARIWYTRGDRGIGFEQDELTLGRFTTLTGDPAGLTAISKPAFEPGFETCARLAGAGAIQCGNESDPVNGWNGYPAFDDNCYDAFPYLGVWTIQVTTFGGIEYGTYDSFAFGCTPWPLRP